VQRLTLLLLLLLLIEKFIASRSGLVGTLPTEFGSATSLGKCHACGALEQVFLRRKTFSSLSILLVVSLVLDGNGIAGTLPSELGLLQSLQHLDLEQNQLVEAIPTELGNLFELREFYTD